MLSVIGTAFVNPCSGLKGMADGSTEMFYVMSSWFNWTIAGSQNLNGKDNNIVSLSLHGAKQPVLQECWRTASDRGPIWRQVTKFSWLNAHTDGRKHEVIHQTECRACSATYYTQSATCYTWSAISWTDLGVPVLKIVHCEFTSSSLHSSIEYSVPLALRQFRVGLRHQETSKWLRNDKIYISFLIDAKEWGPHLYMTVQ